MITILALFGFSWLNFKKIFENASRIKITR